MRTTAQTYLYARAYADTGKTRLPYKYVGFNRVLRQFGVITNDAEAELTAYISTTNNLAGPDTMRLVDELH